MSRKEKPTGRALRFIVQNGVDAETRHLVTTSARLKSSLTKLPLAAPECHRFLERIERSLEQTLSIVGNERDIGTQSAAIRDAYTVLKHEFSDAAILVAHELDMRCERLRKVRLAVGSAPLIQERIATIIRKLHAANRIGARRAIAPLERISDECIRIRSSLDELDVIANERKGWGNPRHHAVGAIIAIIVMVLGIAATPMIEGRMAIPAHSETAVEHTPAGRETAHSQNPQTRRSPEQREIDSAKATQTVCQASKPKALRARVRAHLPKARSVEAWAIAGARCTRASPAMAHFPRPKPTLKRKA